MAGKNSPQSYSEMVVAGKEKREKSKLYKAESAQFVDEQLTTLISRYAKELQNMANRQPVSLTDLERVKRITIDYVRACAASASFPSVTGLARALGMSRQALYDCISRQSPPDTAKWLEVCRESFCEILGDSALRNNCNSIVAIFLQKAEYGLRDNIEIITRKEISDPLGQNISIAELTQKYGDLPED